jgi:TetR/AcrR family transcriptional regulator, tetracycline repressor protein
MSIQKSQIIQTAIAILDRDGLEGVTLRRLAKELDIKAASIYWHIPSKERLLDEMANAILVEQFGTFDFKNDERDWAEWLDTLAHMLRTAMLAHREGARVVAGAHPDIAVMLVKLWDLTVRVLHKHGFSYGKSVTIALTLINFTFGSVIEEQASPPHAPAPDEMPNDLPSILESFQAMATAMEAWQDEGNDGRFDTGVRIIINGVRAEIGSQNTDTV